ncbi:hypothetical protein G4X40_18735 [Rhodococcus sp. D2-41]|uniref:hypothetical protein n=1 Tax=Speluncibacter jeojiensis TaxID=2710754 RepID=UPI00240FE18A|nr:hypothetical protein [Rhodococcus sp. D2-41]MDG3012181.1 hypothetical protein [Rhodococcus sp. D2-41]
MTTGFAPAHWLDEVETIVDRGELVTPDTDLDAPTACQQVSARQILHALLVIAVIGLVVAWGIAYGVTR